MMPSVRSATVGGARKALAIAATLTLLLSKSRGQQQYVDQPPVNKTVLLGRYASFHCSSVSSGGTIIWFMNETLIHQLPTEYDAASVSSQRTDEVDGENSTLSVLGSEQTNGTQYRCGVLDLATTRVVDYSAAVTLTVQGIPLPPTGLQLRVIFIKELEITFILTWIPPRTLFDENNVNVNRQAPIYIVYAYMELNSSSSLLYRTEVASSSKNITLTDLNVSACNLSGVFFRVSAKFEGVGEGAMSHPEGFDRRDAEGVCMTASVRTMEVPEGGLKGGKNVDSQVIAASVGSVLAGILIAIIIVVTFAIVVYRNNKSKDMNLSANRAYGTVTAKETEMCTDSAPAVEDQHVYEHVHDTVKETMVETHANQAYEPVNISKE